MSLSMVVQPANGRVIVGGNFNITQRCARSSAWARSTASRARSRPWAANTVIQNSRRLVRDLRRSRPTATRSTAPAGRTSVAARPRTSKVCSRPTRLTGVHRLDRRRPRRQLRHRGHGRRRLHRSATRTTGACSAGTRSRTRISYQRTMAINKYKSPTLTDAYGTPTIWQPFQGTPGRAAAALDADADRRHVHRPGPGRVERRDDQRRLRRRGRRVPEGQRHRPAGSRALRRARRSRPAPTRRRATPSPRPCSTAQGPEPSASAWTAAWDRDNAKPQRRVLRGATTATSDRPQDVHDRTRPGGTVRRSGSSTPRARRAEPDLPDPGHRSVRQRRHERAGHDHRPGRRAAASTVRGRGPWPTTRPATGASARPAAPTALDRAGSNDLTVERQRPRNTAGALLNETDSAVTFPGTTNTTTVQGVTPVLAVAVRRRSRSRRGSTRPRTPGGKIIGFGDSNTGRSSSDGTDRHHLHEQRGQLYFGVRPDMGTRITINSPSSYRDGQWHHVVGTLSSRRHEALRRRQPRRQQRRRHEGAGVPRLLARRRRPARIVAVARRPARRSPRSIDEVAVYPTALSLGRIRQHFLASGRTTVFPNINPIAGVHARASTRTATFTSHGRPTTTARSPRTLWNFGDGPPGPARHTVHTYPAAGGTYTSRRPSPTTGAAPTRSPADHGDQTRSNFRRPLVHVEHRAITRPASPRRRRPGRHHRLVRVELR